MMDQVLLRDAAQTASQPLSPLAERLFLLQQSFNRVVSPRPFAKLTDVEELMTFFKSRLPKAAQGALLFGFSNDGLARLLVVDLKVNPQANRLECGKKQIDAASLRAANALPVGFVPPTHPTIDGLADWCIQQARPLFQDDFLYHQRLCTHEVFCEIIRLYLYRKLSEANGPSPQTTLDKLWSEPEQRRPMLHWMTVDALYKADALRVLLGEEHPYSRLWTQHQMFRFLVAQHIANEMDPADDAR
ncbi:MAG: hypothetical protein SFZ03_03715 [Candidatus Melainabacteria bacterium]|nr:hypothetical protein [Candidatus Melainabacteria bacterium]